jgi:Macrocin-O-methyltransferase (TylF)
MSQNATLVAELGHHSAKYTSQEQSTTAALVTAFESSPLSIAQRLHAFTRHVRRQDVARFMAKYELMKLILPVNGSIAECGVFAGSGLFSWLHFSSILEPYNHTRRIIGFDTFSGFPCVDDKDLAFGSSEHLHASAFSTHSNIEEELEHLAALHDRNRPLGHIPKIELVAGNACEAIPRYVERSPHLLLSLVYLDFDIYEPTKAALKFLFDRVVKGGIVAFDELNCQEFPGETAALLETLDLSNVELRRFAFEPYISYFVKS